MFWMQSLTLKYSLRQQEYDCDVEGMFNRGNVKWKQRKQFVSGWVYNFVGYSRL